jgi:hypothetical protein
VKDYRLSVRPAHSSTRSENSKNFKTIRRLLGWFSIGGFVLGLGGLGSRFLKTKMGVVIRTYWEVVIREYSGLLLHSS